MFIKNAMILHIKCSRQNQSTAPMKLTNTQSIQPKFLPPMAPSNHNNKQKHFQTRPTTKNNRQNNNNNNNNNANIVNKNCLNGGQAIPASNSIASNGMSINKQQLSARVKTITGKYSILSAASAF